MANRNLRWSERALGENEKLLDYLLNEWGEEITLRVKEQIEKTAVESFILQNISPFF